MKKTPPKVGSKRKRTRYENQKFPLQGKKTKTFMEAIGEPVSTGGFSNLEFLMISSTFHWLAMVEWEEIETQDVHTIYNAIVQLTHKMMLNIGLFEHSVSEIDKLIKKFNFKWDMFRHRKLAMNPSLLNEMNKRM